MKKKLESEPAEEPSLDLRRDVPMHGCMSGEAGCPICHPERYEYVNGKRKPKRGMSEAIWG